MSNYKKKDFEDLKESLHDLWSQMESEKMDFDGVMRSLKGITDNYPTEYDENKTFHIRVRAEYVEYYEIKANSLNDAEQQAQDLLFKEMNDQVDGSFDFEEYDIKNRKPN